MLSNCDFGENSWESLVLAGDQTNLTGNQSNSHIHTGLTTGKSIALIRWTFVGKVMSLLFNMLSRLVITFLPRSKHLLISWLQSPSAVILDHPPTNKNKVCHHFHCFHIYLPWSDGTRCHDLSFLNVELYANFSTLLFQMDSKRYINIKHRRLERLYSYQTKENSKKNLLLKITEWWVLLKMP